MSPLKVRDPDLTLEALSETESNSSGVVSVACPSGAQPSIDGHHIFGGPVAYSLRLGAGPPQIERWGNAN